MKVAASPRVYMGRCPRVAFKSPVTSHQPLVTSPLSPKKTVLQKVLDKSTMDGYTNMRNLRAARWCSGLTCRPVTAEIVSSNLIRVASAEVAQW